MGYIYGPSGVTGTGETPIIMKSGPYWSAVCGMSPSNVTSQTRTWEIFDTQTQGDSKIFWQHIHGRGGGQQSRSYMHGYINLSQYPGGSGSWAYYEDFRANSGFAASTPAFFKSGTKIYFKMQSSTSATGSGHLYLRAQAGDLYPTFDGTYTTT